MKCIMHKSLWLKNSKPGKLFEVSVIYSVNSLCFYQHSAQRAGRDRNSALKSAKSIFPYMSLLSIYRKILKKEKSFMPDSPRRVKSWRPGGYWTPQGSHKAQSQTLGSQNGAQATSSLLLRIILISTPHPAAQDLGLVGAPWGWQEHHFPSKAHQRWPYLIHTHTSSWPLGLKGNLKPIHAMCPLFL